MPLKNSNAVAVERRADLASLFCMIGRHGPAVVLAAVALVSVLAAFVIYRTVRGKRRRATAAAADGDGGRGATANRPEHEPNPEPNPEDAFGRTDSADVSDEGSSDVKEAASLIHPNVRLRRAAADEKKPPPCSSAHGGHPVPVPAYGHQVLEEPQKDVKIPEKEVEPAVDSPVPFDRTSRISESIDETLKNSVTHRSKDEKQRPRLQNNQKQDEDEMAAVHEVKESESTQSDDSSRMGLSSDSQAKVSGLDRLTQPSSVVPLAEEPPQQQNGSMTKNHLAALVPCGCDEESDQNVTACQDQQSDSMGAHGAFETRVDSAADACGAGTGGAGAPVKSEGASLSASSATQQPSAVSEVTSPVGGVNPSICKIDPLSFEQSEQTENDRDGAASPAVGPESGISSMAVSPDSPNAGAELAFPASACRARPEDWAEAQSGVGAEAAASFATDDRYGSVNEQKPLSKTTDWAEHGSAAANEDVFGHEVDDRYQSALDQYMAQITASVTSEPMKTTAREDAGGVEVRAGCGESVRKKEMQVKEEDEEECEKTEISIMEATMDNNEWITDSNYQVLPWMNVCASPLAQSDQNPRPVPLRAAEDAAPAEVQPKPVLGAGAGEEKKVVAVQPMPQNVSVTFQIHYTAQNPYQTVAVTGNRPELGNWREFIPLERAEDGHWAAAVSLPADSHAEWKFVLLDKGEVCRWEECGNRLLDTGCGEDVLLHKWWGLL